MKVKFTVHLGESEVNEIVEIQENKIKGTGCQPTLKLQQMLYDWVDKQVSSSYQILDDERFDDVQCNLPQYVDYMTAKRLRWLE